MTTPDINWTERARQFCRANDFNNVTLIENAMKDGANLAVQWLETEYVKANNKDEAK